MKTGFNINALYFHSKNTSLQIILGSVILLSMDFALQLDIPYHWTFIASLVFALLHNTLWNTLHLDMHEARADIVDGLPCVPFDRKGPFSPYIQWVFDNHKTHHDVGGGQNFNVVLPGPDVLFNTYLHRSRSMPLVDDKRGQARHVVAHPGTHPPILNE